MENLKVEVQRATLLHTLSRLKQFVTAKERRSTRICRTNKQTDTCIMGQILQSFQHLISANGAECILEIKFQNSAIQLQVIKIQSGGMNHWFCASSNCISHLLREQKWYQILFSLFPCSLDSKCQKVHLTASGNTPASLFSSFLKLVHTKEKWTNKWRHLSLKDQGD